ncbi:MAG: FprA family A-type flavoprotein [Candidatus Cryptobacteroides sp.]|nr:FprA family A-type flavoprotein [Candidatus Cryptobacteroides sp.]
MKSISTDIIYIGTDDLSIDLFEGQYKVPQGVSYNSYLILDEKTAILDTVDSRKAEEWLANLETALDGRIPDYLVVHHLEPDHSSVIAAVAEKYPSMTIVAGAKALAMIPQFFENLSLEGRTMAMKEGQVLELGKHSLKFVSAPMVHWPEVMVSFDEFDGTLYSADGFGKFGALSECGFYSSEDKDWDSEARRYYCNIVGKYGAPVQALLKKASALPIKRICPLHGPIIDSDFGHYISLYDKWSRYEPETEGVLIAYASMHGGTEAAALKLSEMLREKGVETVEFDLCRCDLSAVLAEAFRYPKIVLAAASYDNYIFTPMYNFIHLLQIKGLCDRKVGLIENGSWAPCAGRLMKEMLGQMKNMEVVEPTVTIRSRMHSSDIDKLAELAQAMA